MVWSTGTRRPVERQLGGVRAAVAELVELAGHAHAGRGRRDDDLADATRAALVGGAGEQAEPVGLDAVGDVELRPVDHPLVAVADRAGLQAGDVGAGVGLGHRDRADHLAPDRRDEVALLQLLGAEAVQRRGRHVGLHGDRHAHAGGVAAPDLLGEHHREQVVRAPAAVRGVVLEAQEAEVAELREQLVRRHPPVALPPVDVRVDLPLDERPHRLAERLVLLGERDHLRPPSGRAAAGQPSGSSRRG